MLRLSKLPRHDVRGRKLERVMTTDKAPQIAMCQNVGISHKVSLDQTQQRWMAVVADSFLALRVATRAAQVGGNWTRAQDNGRAW